MIPLVDLQANYRSLKKEIDEAIQQVITDSAFIRGSRIATFESAFADLSGADHCVSVANGTDALYISLRMLGIGPGDEVITTCSSWISTSESISQTGATPVFADIEKNYPTIDPDHVEALITQNTVAILPVHLHGQPARMDRLSEIAERHGLAIIEDCAQAHLATFAGRPVGTWGQAGTFSFYPGKNLGAFGDAGAIITNSQEFAEKTACFARHGASPSSKHDHVMEGINSRMDGLQAAVLNVKLPHLRAWTENRREVARHYRSGLVDSSSITCPKSRENGHHVYHVFEILTKYRDHLLETLPKKGISVARHYPKLLPRLQAYAHHPQHRETFPNADKRNLEALSLPIYPELTFEQTAVISDAIITCISSSQASN